MKKILKIILGLLGIAAIILVNLYMSVEVKRDYKTSHVEIDNNLRSVFTDKNSVQLPTAKRMGVSPQKDFSEISTLVNEGKLVILYPCRYYLCMALMPYLTPEAADLLAEIGRRYQEELGYSFRTPIVTSMFRTHKSVNILQKYNSNAVKNSCHLYGTTFDITYSRMNAKEKKVMAQILADLREAGYCHVLYEVNQPCFHITVRSYVGRRHCCRFPH